MFFCACNKCPARTIAWKLGRIFTAPIRRSQFSQLCGKIHGTSMKIWNLCIYWRCTSKNFPGVWCMYCFYLLLMMVLEPAFYVSNTFQYILWSPFSFDRFDGIPMDTPFIKKWTNLGSEISESPLLNAPKSLTPHDSVGPPEIHRDIHLDHVRSSPPKNTICSSQNSIKFPHSIQIQLYNPSIFFHPNFTGRWWLQTLRKTERTVPWIAIFTTWRNHQRPGGIKRWDCSRAFEIQEMLVEQLNHPRNGKNAGKKHPKNGRDVVASYRLYDGTVVGLVTNHVRASYNWVKRTWRTWGTYKQQCTALPIMQMVNDSNSTCRWCDEYLPQSPQHQGRLAVQCQGRCWCPSCINKAWQFQWVSRQACNILGRWCPQNTSIILNDPYTSSNSGRGRISTSDWECGHVDAALKKLAVRHAYWRWLPCMLRAQPTPWSLRPCVATHTTCQATDFRLAGLSIPCCFFFWDIYIYTHDYTCI